MDHIEFSRRLDDATVDIGVLIENRFKAQETTINRLLTEIGKWKDASGLERGGDPDGVTPDDLRNELDHLRATQEKSWSAADEALCAQYETALRDLFDACDVLMGDSDLPDDDSKEMVAMRRAAAILKEIRALANACKKQAKEQLDEIKIDLKSVNRT